MDQSAPITPAHVPPSLIYDYDFVADPRLNDDPFTRMQSLHREAPPLFYSPHYGGHWVVTSRKLLQEIAYNPTDFSSRNRMLPPADQVPVLIPATFDPPEHGAYRTPLNRHFFPNAIHRHAPFIRATLVALIEAVRAKPSCDFLHEIAEPFPPTIFFKILGVPLDRLREFRGLAHTFMGSNNAAARDGALASIADIVRPTVASRMQTPQDDLISVLATTDFDGRKLSMEELINYAVILFIGGLDTVVNAAAFSIRYLAIHQDLQARLRAGTADIPKAVDELLRLHTVATPMRTATRDLELGGQRIRQGDQLVLMVAAINYDPEHFLEPEKFCPHRAEHHVAFNVGIHRCVGANLGKLELEILLEEWLSRIPHFRLDPAQPPSFEVGFSISVKSLNLLLS